MTRILILAALSALVLAGILPGLMAPVQAIPVFTRKYGFNCTMCHSNFPRLNDFGMAYRLNDYQLPDKEVPEKTVLEGLPPFAARIDFGANYDKFTSPLRPSSNVHEFQLNTLDLLSGGLLRRNLGYIASYAPPLTAGPGVAGQEASLELANVVFSRLLCHRHATWLNLRVGRFEPSGIAFSNLRSLTVSPYEVYDFTFSGGMPFSQVREGAEIYGYGRSRFYYAAGAVASAGSDTSSKVSADYYARVFKVFGPGWGQTAGQRIGLSVYYGRSYPAAAFVAEIAPFPWFPWIWEGGEPFPGEVPAADSTVQIVGSSKRYDFFRFGWDASLNAAWINLSLQYLLAMDRRELWFSTSSKKYLLTHGGFAQVNLMPTDELVGFARFDLVKPEKPSDIGQGDVYRYTAGLRYYFAYNLALHVEYSHRQEKRVNGGPTAKEDFATARLDFAF